MCICEGRMHLLKHNIACNQKCQHYRPHPYRADQAGNCEEGGCMYLRDNQLYSTRCREVTEEDLDLLLLDAL